MFALTQSLVWKVESNEGKKNWVEHDLNFHDYEEFGELNYTMTQDTSSTSPLLGLAAFHRCIFKGLSADEG